VPADWQPLGRRSSLPGLEEATAVRGVHSEIALDIRAPEDESLLPAGVGDAVAGDLPEPRARRLDSRTAWRYDLPPASPGTRVVALALPTTGGMVTIACAARRGRGAACRRDDRAGRTAPRFAAGGRDRAAGASLSGCARSRAIAWTMSP
jgi:hypothetical protein